jgi:hypothetical protein
MTLRTPRDRRDIGSSGKPSSTIRALASGAHIRLQPAGISSIL